MLIDNAKQSKSLFSISFLLTTCSAFLIPTIKLSFIIGSFFSFFSIKNCIIPLSGAFGGITGGTLFSALRLLICLLSTGHISLKILAFYIPGLFGSLYWASRSAMIRIIVPAVCMILFCLHPVGSQAYAYSLFWLIPIALFFVPKKSIFLEALGSTYTAHAIGSVIWLYTREMTAATWLSLIPVACMERFLFACGMTVAYGAIAKIATTVTSLLSSYKSRKTHISSSLNN